ncbi:hypothetical protein D9758_014658 [Tetrapyrgos nigripes]|uniref:Uncharacterized protein n=1 Tax=Tetrapyrgos nigripes TaxID=182062 RepID=A0A8H5CV68_9AGAR|nr:hypothetical protein D9758_014658 [Tetrapyrgos nigripes]
MGRNEEKGKKGKGMPVIGHWQLRRRRHLNLSCYTGRLELVYEITTAGFMMQLVYLRPDLGGEGGLERPYDQKVHHHMKGV